ncbi:cytochrome c-type biogenesis protein [Thalassolituus hydrocarboniclasticus]|uniref:Cytochrome c-type biogenesis protein n=1 Tax=Thalassolituus hydrocarboniclasticus TaxID=2742796 RepID=A0ABY6A7Y3_9GAMM|nr:cytochrome c-type biogenesis protein [Thalassolituus hydrocarboniclasticus]UXD87049.1 cytochrome c-type biogenesis protein CcmH [Thalassolituus hydrocarboniclasticus]
MKQMFLFLCLLLPLSALATVDGYKYPFDDPEDAARFEQLAQDLRCPKCQNQNLADSNAPVAVDLRDKVYELMQEGQSDEEIVGYLVDRYGDFVRYNPPFRAETVLLWFGPALVFIFGLLLLVLIRRGQKQPPKPLSAEEQARLQALKNKAKSS